MKKRVFPAVLTRHTNVSSWVHESAVSHWQEAGDLLKMKRSPKEVDRALTLANYFTLDWKIVESELLRYLGSCRVDKDTRQYIRRRSAQLAAALKQSMKKFEEAVRIRESYPRS